MRGCHGLKVGRFTTVVPYARICRTDVVRIPMQCSMAALAECAYSGRYGIETLRCRSGR
jgi:hypothetical protein